MSPAPAPEPCVFVLWESARGHEAAILADLGSRFDLAEVVEVAWRPERFSRNLARLYGTLLPPGSSKELESGTGPFLVAVCVDPRPRYGRRRTSRGLRRVNVHCAAAKSRYRRWTGGGFRVHGSLDRDEAVRDLQLLLRLDPGEATGRRWDGSIGSSDGGDAGWDDPAQLLASIAAATPAELIETAPGAVALRAEDLWWAVLIAGGDPPAETAREAELVVSVAGEPTSLRVERRRPVSG